MAYARPGDEVAIRGHRIDASDRRGPALAARGADGASPFVTRWDDTGHTTVLRPGTDCEIQRLEHRSTDRRGEDR